MRIAKVLLPVVVVLALTVSCGDSGPTSGGNPPDPSTLSASSDFGVVQLSWSECTNSDFARYDLHRSTTSGIEQNPGTPLATFSNSTDTTYNDESVEQDMTYYYAVKTVDDGDLTAWSNEVMVNTPVEAEPGDWSGTTDQGKPIEFYVTSDRTLGQLYIELDIAMAPDFYWNFSGYTSYGTDGTWSMSGIDTVSSHVHEIEISGDFTSSNLCEGEFTANSETYYSGYYIDGTFEVYPESQ